MFARLTSRLRTSPPALLLICAATLLAACGGNDDADKAQVRLVNATSGGQKLDLRVDGGLRQTNVEYGNSAGYINIDPDKTDSSISVSGSATPLVSFTQQVRRRNHYTILAFGPEGAVRQVPLDDNLGDPPNNEARLRVVNAASDAGPLDVYITGSNESLGASTAAVSGAAYGAVGAWTNVNANTWRVRVTAAGSKTDVRLDLPAVAFGSKQITTLVLVSGGGGVLVNGLFLAQQGSIARADMQQARVRLVAGISNAGTVAATIGGVQLSGGIGSPGATAYQLVPAGTQSVTLTVNTTTITVLAETLTASVDYTYLVRGSATGPLVNLIRDNNRLPSDITRANLRLVNGRPDVTPPVTVSLKLDFEDVTSGVKPGESSPPVAVAPTSGTGDGRLTVTQPGLAAPVYEETGRALVAGAVYSLFVLDETQPAKGILRRDR